MRAQNLSVFVQLAEGVDDATWCYPLRKHDYSEWLRQSVKDGDVADEVARIEANSALGAAESRSQIFQIIRRRYTAPE